MLCEKCRSREANIRYTEIVNGVRTEHNLCIQCAREMEFGQYSAVFDTEHPIGKILSELFGIEPEVSGSEDEAKNRIVCPTCGTAYREFAEGSRFGCPDCASVFELLMNDMIRKIQGSDTHTGKRPKGLAASPSCGASEADADQKKLRRTQQQEDLEEKVRILQCKLKEAVEEEAYEQAAAYRDEIRELKERLHADV